MWLIPDYENTIHSPRTASESPYLVYSTTIYGKNWGNYTNIEHRLGIDQLYGSGEYAWYGQLKSFIWILSKNNLCDQILENKSPMIISMIWFRLEIKIPAFL